MHVNLIKKCSSPEKVLFLKFAKRTSSPYTNDLANSPTIIIALKQPKILVKYDLSCFWHTVISSKCKDREHLLSIARSPNLNYFYHDRSRKNTNKPLICLELSKQVQSSLRGPHNEGLQWILPLPRYKNPNMLYKK